jgi:hypothetical protein
MRERSMIVPELGINRT